MVNIIFEYDDRVLKGVISDVSNAPKKFLDFAEKTIPPLLHKEIQSLRTEPREPTLPFIWSYDSGKQRSLRNAYFRKLPKGSRGGRYRRSHKLVQSWVTGSIRKASEATFTVGNDTPYLDTVQGKEQYPSHADSGWVQYDGVLVKTAEKAIDTLTVGWLNILD
jgi:hypothetical protein